MADPLSIAAGVVGITAVALHGLHLLAEDIDQVKTASKTFGNLLEEVRSVEASLKLLGRIEEQEWKHLGSSIAEESNKTISSCQTACESFRADFKRWTRHSEDGKLAWQDRASIGLFKKGPVRVVSGQLQNCKLSVNTVVNIATL